MLMILDTLLTRTCSSLVTKTDEDILGRCYPSQVTQ